MGHDGVFIRAISPGTLVAQEGTLRVGDRIWRIQDEEVGQEESPASVVKKLKEIEGQLRIEVKGKTINDS
jgi:C-terminal processing protease CtpA/Prc